MELKVRDTHSERNLFKSRCHQLEALVRDREVYFQDELS